MSIVDKLLLGLTERQREEYVCWLREIVGAPSVGGYGQYLGSLVPIIFASEQQKLEAFGRIADTES